MDVEVDRENGPSASEGYSLFMGLYIPSEDSRCKITESMLLAGQSALDCALDGDRDDVSSLIANAYIAMKALDPDFHPKNE